MGQTIENVDTEALAEAEKVLGTKGGQDTVNAALKDVVQRRLVAQYFDLAQDVDPAELDRIQAEAWH